MKVIICDDELTATNDAGKILKINGVLIKKAFPKMDAFYPLDDAFTKLILAKGTPHDAVEITDDLINIL